MAALSDVQRNFLARVRAFVPLAEGAGVSGTVMLAQAAIESNWGRSGLARHGNALFGVKARSGWRGKVYSGTTREWVAGRGYLTIPGTNRVYEGYDQAVAAGCQPGALFRAYDSLEDNIRDYAAFFHANPRYHRALQLYALTHDPNRFAVEIARAGYATSPTYAEALVELMSRCVPGVLAARHQPLTVQIDDRVLDPDSVHLFAGRLFVRLRAVASALGCSIEYDSDLKKATLSLSDHR